MNSTFKELATLYKDMEKAYAQTAKEAGLTCKNCPDNCCFGFFKHHTRVEWIYLLKGIRSLPTDKQKLIKARAEDYVKKTKEAKARNKLPHALCPLNEDGLCILYQYRLMICRMHGTKNTMTLPDGSERSFSGCSRFVSLTSELEEDKKPSLDRTPYYRRLAELEMRLMKRVGRPLPNVDITIAEMIVAGPPELK